MGDVRLEADCFTHKNGFAKTIRIKVDLPLRMELKTPNNPSTVSQKSILNEFNLGLFSYPEVTKGLIGIRIQDLR